MKTVRVSDTLMGDIFGGLAAMLVALPSAIAFGIIIYSPLGPQYIGIAAMAGMVGTVALGESPLPLEERRGLSRRHVLPPPPCFPSSSPSLSEAALSQ